MMRPLVRDGRMIDQTAISDPLMCTLTRRVRPRSHGHRALIPLMLLAAMVWAPLAAHEVWSVILGETPAQTLEIYTGDRLIAAIEEQSAAAGLQGLRLSDHAQRWLFGVDRQGAIDLQRPIRFAWSTDGTIRGVIPLADRTHFLESFTVLPLGGTELIRIGEREGTIVYAFNAKDGLREYRLLIRDGTAYLGGSVADCEDLAERSWPALQGDAPVLTFHRYSPSVRIGWEQLPASWSRPLRMTIAALAQSVLDRVLSETERISWIIDHERHGAAWTLRAELVARSGSGLANWFAGQQPVASRFLSALPGDGLLQMHGHLRWNGALERSAAPVIDALTTTLTADFRPSGWAERFRRWLSRIDGLGAFALQLDAPEQAMRVVQIASYRDVTAMSLAAESLQQIFRIPLSAAGFVIDGDEGDAQLEGYPLRWRSLLQQRQVLLTGVSLQSEDILVSASGTDDRAQLARTCLAAITALDQQAPPTGHPAIVALVLHADRWLARWADHFGVAHGDVAPVPLLVTLEEGEERGLQLHCRIPLEALAELNQVIGLRTTEWRRLWAGQ